MRLKSKTHHVPGDFQYIQPEAGMKKPFSGSFDSVVQKVIALRKGNKFLAQKNNWAMDYDTVAKEIEEQNVARCIAHGWTNFLVSDETPPPRAYEEMVGTDEAKKKEVGNVAGVLSGARRIAAGVKVLLDWLGSGAKNVPAALATSRAAICADCPKNDGGDWRSVFTQPVAARIRQQIEIKNEMKLATIHDAKLTVCSACLCPLQLKVWTPIEHIAANTSDEVRSNLHPLCWILSETKA